jgi:hypothetical protein
MTVGYLLGITISLPALNWTFLKKNFVLGVDLHTKYQKHSLDWGFQCSQILIGRDFTHTNLLFLFEIKG